LELRNKTIIIISQEEWGEMFLSKHHYAVELGKRGNKVFFINYPDRDHKLKRGEIKISPTNYKNVQVVQHRLFFPYFFKYDYTWLYNFLVRFQIARILKKMGARPHLVWSFDLSNAMPLKEFSKKYTKIFMPVDEPFHAYSIEAAKGADIMFSVTNEILKKYSQFNVPKHFINHGVAEYFISNNSNRPVNTPIRIGYSGGLLRPEIDWETFLAIIKENKDKIFEFWGEYDYDTAFISKAKYKNEIISNYIKTLKGLPNVKLHGVVNSARLFDAIKEVDVLIICYDIKKDQSHGTNYHKILEYLGTGNVVISNNVSTYWENYPGMIEMIESREDNHALPALFSTVTNSLNSYNSREKRESRINFAKSFVYSNQLTKIEGFLKDFQ
jgi:hypothetical protein